MISFLRKSILTTYLIIIISFLVLFLIIITIKMKNITIDSMDIIYDSSIISEVEVYEYENSFRITGFAYHPQNLLGYSNYISGSGKAYLFDSFLFLENDNEIIRIYTSSKYVPGLVDTQGIDISNSGIYGLVNTSVLVKGEKYKIGVAITVNNETFYKFTDSVINYE